MAPYVLEGKDKGLKYCLNAKCVKSVLLLLFFGRNQNKSEKNIFLPGKTSHAKSCTAEITALLVHTLHCAGGIPSQHQR